MIAEPNVGTYEPNQMTGGSMGMNPTIIVVGMQQQQHMARKMLNMNQGESHAINSSRESYMNFFVHNSQFKATTVRANYFTVLVRLHHQQILLP